MVTIKEIKAARTTNTFFSRSTASIAVVCMLVLAGHGASQSTPQDDEPHELHAQVEAALAQHGVSVPADLQFLLEPMALDALAAYYAHALSNGQGPWDATAIVLLLRQGLHDNPVLADHPNAEWLMDGVDEDVQELLDALKQPTGMCMHDGFDLVPEVGLLAGPSCLLLKAAGPALVIATIVLAIVAPIAVEGAKIVLYLDDDADEIGDDWGDYWKDVSGLLSFATDWDSDDLSNIREFRWELFPICVGALPDDPRTQLVDESLLTSDNCTDYDDDNWRDGPEVVYWNNEDNDAVLSEDGVAFLDPDRTLNTDNDTLRNTYDPDSDDDDLDDGDEIMVGSYPEFRDSDCDVSVPACTVSWDTTYWDTTRVGKPGTGDGITDAEELAYWNTISTSAWQTKYDDDNIASNLLDPDSDGDTLLDGEEILVHNTKPYSVDSDIDGLTDDAEVRVHATDPNHWDSDGDLMPDWWEVEYHLNPNVNDANQDGDRDGLSNVQEYRYARPGGWDEATDGAWTGGTNPIDPDTEGDGLFDGPEVLDHETDPFWWDTDSDGLPDAWEVDHDLQPLVNDAIGDPDADFFDQGNDGSIEQTWTNIQEYEYGKPPEWNEELTGPWPGGTDPKNPDTDGDTAKDGQEVYFETDPRVNNNVDPSGAAGEAQEWVNDDDLDGLNWTEEARMGTNPNDPDTDGDGLCDGGRAENCVWLGVGFQPGERDYGSTPWSGDSDGDGLGDFAEVNAWDPGRSGDAADTDGDLLNGVIDSDNDDDGLLDGQEPGYGTLMQVPDSDGDGLRDGEEVYIHNTSPSDEDTDGDLLTDGAEIQAHTDPHSVDSDGDGLTDGAEALTHGTNPLAPDSDADGLPDAWEVAEGTRARAADADVDGDGDGLNNFQEYRFGSSPVLTDTDSDTLPDGWEYRYDLNPRFPSQNLDSDGDGSLNGDEFIAGTSPRDADSDDDGLSDGDEAAHGSLPLRRDSDEDGLLDGEEVHVHGSLPMERDSDRDGLSDFDEVFTTKTKPRNPDSDGDGLSDYEEVFAYQGKYDPNDPDTDGDGLDDGDEAALADPSGDFDNDGINNGDEATYGTSQTEPDSDCDGIQDGAEVAFWNARQYPLSTFKPYLQDPDVDGDGIKDGVETGTAGTERKVLYRSAPDRVDTDGDGLDDNEEARNNVRVSCNQAQTQSSPKLPEPVPGPSLQGALQDASRLIPGVLYEAPEGVVFGVDEEGVYIQGGYGVRLYPVDVAMGAMDPFGLIAPWSAAMAVGTNGKLSDPALVDTEGDGVDDGVEVAQALNPTLCDSDGDGLGDALELQVPGKTVNVNDPCTHLDSDPTTGTDPKSADSDGDGLLDGTEDKNANGQVDITLDDVGYCGVSGSESDPGDLDSDEDGIPDLDEIRGLLSGSEPTSAFCFDSDGDGLSDGLEVGLKAEDKTPDTISRNVDVHGFIVKTWQPSTTGLKLNPNLFDFDSDGIPDGLEDLDTDGVWGLAEGEMDPLSLDTDMDGVTDGRELLLYGLGNHVVPFEAVLNEWGGSTSKVQYDSASLFQTNPLDPNTDGDDAIDGFDLNPVDDALLALDFGKFYSKQRPDCDATDWKEGWRCAGNDDGWTAEIYVSKLAITLPMAKAPFVVETTENDWVAVWTKDARHLPGGLMDVLTDPSKRVTAPSGIGHWALQRLVGAGSTTILVDLPDSGVDLTRGDQEVKVDLFMRDHDVTNDDDLDLNPAAGASMLHHTFKLGRPLSGEITSEYPHLAVDEHFRDHTAKDKKAGDNKNAALKLRMGSNVHEHFFKTVNAVLFSDNAGLPAGTCFASDDCV